MDEETLKILIPFLTGSAGILVKSGYDSYRMKRSKKSKAEVMDRLYSDLEIMYAKDLVLQKQLHDKSLENEELKSVIQKLQRCKNQ